MKKIFYFLLIAMIFQASCKKKKVNNSPIPLATSIEIGNTNGMVVTARNDTFHSGSGPTAYLDLDIDEDGKNDISFWFGRTGYPGIGYAWVTSVSAGGGLEFMGTSYNDSSFYCMDTIISYPGGNPKVQMDIYRKYYFVRQHPTDIVIQNHYPFKTKVMTPSEILRLSDTFLGGQFYLENRNPDQSLCQQSNDTTICFRSNLNLQIYPYGLTPIIYFGFRINDGNTTRLGWIKFSFSDFKVIETAIQKN